MDFKKYLSDPMRHDPQGYIYIVHGVMDWDVHHIGGTQLPLSQERMRTSVERILDPEQFYAASLIGVMDEEHAKAMELGNRSFSQTGTFGNAGLIIEPAHDEIIRIAWNADIGSSWDEKMMPYFVASHDRKIKSASILLYDTKGDEGQKYNELVLKGDAGTAIKGVFFKPRQYEDEVSANGLKQIVHELTGRDVPIIELPVNPKPDYENCKDPEEREKRRMVAFMAANSALQQVNHEFRFGSHIGLDSLSYHHMKSLKNQHNLFDGYSKELRLFSTK
ncbi:MAG: hypothetical protein V1725_02535 [archaeon]